MKLWKSKKSTLGCVPGKSATSTTSATVAAKTLNGLSAEEKNSDANLTTAIPLSPLLSGKLEITNFKIVLSFDLNV